jgi:hypothetical protein
MTLDTNGKKELRAAERRLNDEKIINIKKQIDVHNTRLTDAEDIVKSWKSERRLFMMTLGLLNTLILTLIVGIFMNVSEIKTEFASRNEQDARKMAEIEGNIKNTSDKVAHLKENINEKIYNLSDRINISNQLIKIENKIK